MVEARRQRHDPPEREQAARGLDGRRAALRGRDAEGTGRVRAGRRRHLARCERGARAAARATCRTLEGPRLPTWSVVPPQANSCVCRCPSRPCPRPRGSPRRRSSGRGLVQDPARGGQGLPGDGVKVLQPDRDPTEVGASPATSPLVGACRRLERVLLVDPDPGVHRAGRRRASGTVPLRIRARHDSTSSRERALGSRALEQRPRRRDRPGRSRAIISCAQSC